MQITDQHSLFSDDSHQAGGKPLPLPPGLLTSAIYGGPRQEYRYILSHVWDVTKPAAMWLMMNPSTATERTDDRTVARTRQFSRTWGYGGVIITNTMAYRATYQEDLLNADDPCGPENIIHILEAAKSCPLIIAAYGTPKIKALNKYGPQLIEALRSAGHAVHTLRTSTSGRPVHPLYLPSNLKPVPYTPIPAAPANS